ncbi:hypothetical protein GBK02_11440 [Dechloromonas sp. TW-R-39-2]|uniref:hypothetical protein n=1 Tax=Dechloromonas sp. TW-R-39-2 TaxID=2654218 RepID=UPI00193CED9B|nr:hypothetical protein [Dechloromonas sp. TW-R-39-2]QRM19972.1 hypothetical protein GBK02_11440 [Dechloromonas sp. TW-R-39-2]
MLLLTSGLVLRFILGKNAREQSAFMQFAAHRPTVLFYPHGRCFHLESAFALIAHPYQGKV